MLKYTFKMDTVLNMASAVLNQHICGSVSAPRVFLPVVLPLRLQYVV